MDRENPEILHRRASESYHAGDYEAAREAWSRMLEVAPKDERALEGLRRCDEVAGDSGSDPIGGPEPDLLEDLALEIDEVAASSGAGPEAAAAPSIDPAAMEGLETDSAGSSPVAPAEVDDLESMLLDQEDGPAPASRSVDDASEAAARTEIPTPDRQGDGFDFGRIDDVETIGLGAAAPPSPDAQAPTGSLAEPPPLPPEGAGEPGELPADAVDGELRRRVEELLAEARAAVEDGRDDDALTVLARLSILDEDNAEAQELEDQIRTRRDRAAHEIEDAIAEGVQWLESGDPERAAERFREILAQVPDHQEALHFLERAEAALADRADPGPTERDEDGNVALAAGGEALDVGGELPPTDVFDPGDVALAPGGEAPRLDGAAAETLPRPERVAVAATEPVAARRRRPGPILLAVVGIAAAAAIGWFAFDRFVGGDAEDPGTVAGTAATDGRDASAEPGERSTEELIQEADRLATASLERTPTRTDADRIAAALGRARDAMDTSRWEDAVFAFNEVLKIDPDNGEAAAGLREAGRAYRDRQEQEQEYDRAVRAFAAGDYTSALRTLYRLPSDLRPEEAERLKIEGWYNLGLIELRAGNLDQATANFEEALAIDAEDGLTGEAVAFAERYRGRTKDRSFYDAVERMEFRGPSS